MTSKILLTSRLRWSLMSCFPHDAIGVSRYSSSQTPRFTSNDSEGIQTEEMEFRKLEIDTTKKKKPIRQRKRPEMLSPRSTRMAVDQDWNSVWPTAQSFRPSVVPLPLHQGFVENKAPPGKYGNTELMKIPNFLHLTPPAIKRHCAAIKKFCTAWPKGLETDEKCDELFPVTVITSEYCHAGPSIRDIRARIVTLKLKLSSLKLDEHARDKLLRLVGDRYSVDDDMLTLVTDRCPVRKQNYDYAIYLLTALYHESWKTEPWESEKSEADMEKYVWQGSKSEDTIVQLLQGMKAAASSQSEDAMIRPALLQVLPDEITKKDINQIDVINDYGKAVTDIHNQGEDDYTVNQYKDAVKRLLGFPEKEAATDVVVLS